MVKSRVTQREETSVAKTSRKGLEKATCRRKGYGNSCRSVRNSCDIKSAMNWERKKCEDVSVCGVGFSLTIQRSRVSEEHCLTMFSLYLLLLSVACALLCWYKNCFSCFSCDYYYYYYYFFKIAKIFINIWPIYIPLS